MKKIIAIIFALTIVMSAQIHHQLKDQDISRYEQLEKIKLIELLNLDESTTLKFFARRNESRSRMKQNNDEHHDILEQVSKSYKENKPIQNEEAEKLIKRLQELEKIHSEERQKFISSLNDILNKEQILKYIVFENSFREEVRKKFYNKRRDRKD